MSTIISYTNTITLLFFYTNTTNRTSTTFQFTTDTLRQRGKMCLSTVYDYSFQKLKFIFCEGSTKDIVYHLATLKAMKKNKCRGKCMSRGSSQFYCKPCSRLNKSLCRHYHGVDPVDEIIGRLIYEVLFELGGMSIKHVQYGTWMDMSLRDYGHHLRMVRLINLVTPDFVFIQNLL